MAPAVNKDQTFSAEIVACLLALSSPTVGAKHYALMEKVDGTNTKSGYDHRFRAVKARAKEIIEEIANGNLTVDATPVKPKALANSKTTTPKRKARTELPDAAQSSNACGVQNEDDDEEAKPPSSKRVKRVKSEENDFLT